MEETLMRVVCLGCGRRRFDVRATQVGDETVELCPKCRRGTVGATQAATSEEIAMGLATLGDGGYVVPVPAGPLLEAEPVATLVPDVEGSLELERPRARGFEDIPLSGDGAASLVFVREPVAARCCKRFAKMLVNRFGKTRCLPCDAELMVQRNGHRLLVLAPVFMLALVLFAGCGGLPFAPAYSGEPECGNPATLHAVQGEACDQTITVACDCEERRTLECAEGAWVVRHWGCSGGLSVSVPRAEDRS